MSDNPPSTTSPPKADHNALVPVQDTPKGTTPRRGCWRAVFLAIIVLGLALVAGGWFAYQQFQTLDAQWSAQLAQSRAAIARVQTQAQHAVDALQSQTKQLATVQVDQVHMATQLQNLEHLVQALTPVVDHDSPAVLLGEVGRLVEIAQQSVRLGGNVSAALMALESAQQRLVQRNALPGLQQTLEEDMARLRAVPVVDVAWLAARLDDLSALLAQAPLVLPETLPVVQQTQDGVATHESIVSPPPADTVADAAASWWQRAWRVTQAWSGQAWQAVTQDLRGLIEVRRVDDAAALLLAPDHAAWLRATLQHRVATARLALLMRQPALWTSELTALGAALDARFDARQAPVQQAQALVRTLLETTITVALPTLEDSVRGVAAQRAMWSRAQQRLTPSPEPGVAADPDARERG